MRWRV